MRETHFLDLAPACVVLPSLSFSLSPLSHQNRGLGGGHPFFSFFIRPWRGSFTGIGFAQIYTPEDRWWPTFIFKGLLTCLRPIRLPPMVTTPAKLPSDLRSLRANPNLASNFWICERKAIIATHRWRNIRLKSTARRNCISLYRTGGVILKAPRSRIFSYSIAVAWADLFLLEIIAAGSRRMRPASLRFDCTRFLSFFHSFFFFFFLFSFFFSRFFFLLTRAAAFSYSRRRTEHTDESYSDVTHSATHTHARTHAHPPIHMYIHATYTCVHRESSVVCFTGLRVPRPALGHATDRRRE